MSFANLQVLAVFCRNATPHSLIMPEVYKTLAKLFQIHRFDLIVLNVNESSLGDYKLA